MSIDKRVDVYSRVGMNDIQNGFCLVKAVNNAIHDFSYNIEKCLLSVELIAGSPNSGGQYL